jgi:hypothetical protein
MKKWLIAALVFFVFVIASIYLFIPSTIHISRTVITTANSTALNRKLQDKNTWAKAIDYANSYPGNALSFSSYSYSVNKGLFNEIPVTVFQKNDSIATLVECISIANDSAAIKWSAVIKTSNNPFTKVEQYFKAQKIANFFDDVLAKLKTYTSVQANIYGSTITLQKVTDTSLVTTKALFKTYPSDSSIYDLLNKLRKYISGKALETNPPMLNIKHLPDSNYEVMVALPVNKNLTDSGDIRFKQMFPGRILATEIKGGHKTVEQTFAMMNQYLIDHKYNQPAIPFTSLITNRIDEPDTSKWTAKVYYPVY